MTTKRQRNRQRNYMHTKSSQEKRLSKRYGCPVVIDEFHLIKDHIPDTSKKGIE